MKKVTKEYWFVAIAGVLFGLVVFGGKVLANLGLSLYEMSLLPSLVAVGVLFLFVIFNKECRFKKGTFGMLLFYGLVLSFITVAQFGAVILGVSVAITVLLLYTQPLWTMIFSVFFLKEKIVTKDIISCAIVLLGLFVLVNPFQEWVVNNWIGIIFALIGGISLSGWVVIGRVLSKRGNHPINSLFASNLFMIILLLAVHPLVNMIIHDSSLVMLSLHFTPIIWFYILMFGFFSIVVSQLFYLNGVKKVSAVDAGIILLLEPISGAILAVIFLGQPITLNIITGGFLILFANYLILTKGKTEGQSV